MPKWLTITIDTDIVGGKTFSGFGGLNHFSKDVEKGPSKHTIQSYSFYIQNLVSSGKLELDKEWEFLNNDTKSIIAYIKDNGLPE